MVLINKTISSGTLSTKANKILNVFKSTIDGLKEVASEARTQAGVKQQEADAALAEKIALEDVAVQNEQILNKLQDLLK